VPDFSIPRLFFSKRTVPYLIDTAINFTYALFGQNTMRHYSWNNPKAEKTKAVLA
jgi:hypothetical protein